MSTCADVPESTQTTLFSARKYALTTELRTFTPDGACHENAYYAAKYISRHPVDDDDRHDTNRVSSHPHVTVGLIAQDPNQQSYSPKLPETIEETGRVHHWVYLPDQRLHFDPYALPQVWSSTDIDRGNALITVSDPPDEYVLLDTVPFNELQPFSPEALTSLPHLATLLDRSHFSSTQL